MPRLEITQSWNYEDDNTPDERVMLVQGLTRITDPLLGAGSPLFLLEPVFVGVLDQRLSVASHPLYLIQSRELGPLGIPGIAVDTYIYYVPGWAARVGTTHLRATTGAGEPPSATEPPRKKASHE